MRKTAKNTKNINDEYYQRKGYTDNDLNVWGKPKRGLASFQCEEKLWREFDKMIEEEHGKYKKSYILESLIRKYMTLKESERGDDDDDDKQTT